MIAWFDDRCWAILNVIFLELAVDQASSYINRFLLLLQIFHSIRQNYDYRTFFFDAESNLLIKVQKL